MTGRPAFVFDPDRCTSCEACRVACGIENNGGADTGWRKVITFNPMRHEALPVRHLSLACNHCDVPACALGCPAAAYTRDATTGAVILDPAKCIGCRYCSWLCPYDAPAYDETRGVMTKCTFCAPRLAAGRDPACTQACPTGALSLGRHQWGEPEPEYHGVGATGLGPSLKIVRPRRNTRGSLLMSSSAVAPPAPEENLQPVPPSRITLRAEWALVVFTTLMTALAGWFGAAIMGRVVTPTPLAGTVFALLGATAIFASAVHLGRPARAWRAVLNLRSSWLSREIMFAAAFLLLGTTTLLMRRPPGVVKWSAALAAVALAASIDAVYRAIPRPQQRRLHSAESLLTLAFLIALGSGQPVAAIAVGAIKAALCAGRWGRGELGISRGAATARLALLAAACAWADSWPFAFAAAIAGEVIDRCAFYAELEPATPQRRMAEEMVASGFQPVPE